MKSVVPIAGAIVVAYVAIKLLGFVSSLIVPAVVVAVVVIGGLALLGGGKGGGGSDS